MVVAVQVLQLTLFMVPWVFCLSLPHTGNITSSVESAPPKDLSTPTIKSDFYTTGRGGAGNIAKNDPDRPELARASQDVEPQVSKGKQDHVHYGRGT